MAWGYFGAETTVEPEVDVATADTDEINADEDVVGIVECGDGAVLVFGVARAVEQA